MSAASASISGALSGGSLTVSGASSLGGALDMKSHAIDNISNILSVSSSPAITFSAGATLTSSAANYIQFNGQTFLQVSFVAALTGAATVIPIIPRPTPYAGTSDIFSISSYNGGGAGGIVLITSSTSNPTNLTLGLTRADGAAFTAGSYSFTLQWSYT
jgi:hypothetical protein